MSCKLIVTDKKYPGRTPSLYVFDQDVVTIGRAESNELSLPDEDRIMGRRHLTIRKVGEDYTITNEMSKNPTELNNKLLIPAEPKPLNDGDVFSCGDRYSIAFRGIDNKGEEGPNTASSTQSQPSESTYAGQSEFSDFTDEAVGLAEILAKIYEKYALKGDDREEELKRALSSALANVAPNQASQIILDQINVAANNRAGMSATSGQPDTDHLGQLHLAFVEVISKLLTAYVHFKVTFLEETRVRKRSTKDAFDVDSWSEDEIQNYFFEMVNDSDFNGKLLNVKQVLKELIHHQRAFMAGYRRCVIYGVKELLGDVAPEALHEELRASSTSPRLFKFTKRFLPFIMDLKVLSVYKERFSNIETTEDSYLERRIFRPEFKSGYYASIDS